jgi:hypothetical protein
MKIKKTLSIIFIILGLGLMGMSMYINSQVEHGKGKVSRAQSQVDQGSSLFSISPATKGIGKELTGGAQKKIDAGKEQIAHYEQVAQVCQIGGIIFLIAGVGLFFCCRKKSR